MNISRILLGLMLIVGAGGAIIGGTSAFFSDTESSTGNTFTAGDIDLQIDNESYYNGVFSSSTSWTMTNLTSEKFFNFLDLKPGDFGEDTISLHVLTNDAYMCADVTLTSNDDNVPNEPELEDDLNTGVGQGELAGLVNFAWWADDGDNVFESDETLLSPIGPIGALPLGATTTLALADSTVNIWDGTGPMDGNITHYIGKAWCFGTMAAAPLTQDGLGETSLQSPANTTGGFTCDGTGIDNAAQTDTLTADVSFRAIQSRNNPNFRCVPPDETRACVENEVYASAAYDISQGKRKNGTLVAADRSNSTFALGAPQSLGTPYDTPVVASSFFSLGFKSTPPGLTATTTPGGSIVLEFPGLIVNGAGPDLKLWEVTGGTVYPDELVKVEVSNSLAGPWTLVDAAATRDEEMELPIPSAKYVRITDVSPPGVFEATADGYDLDAVQALNCQFPLRAPIELELED